jgi:hypothetical protein
VKKSLICRCLRDAVKSGTLLPNLLYVKRKAGLGEIGAPILSRYPVAEFLCGSPNESIWARRRTRHTHFRRPRHSDIKPERITRNAAAEVGDAQSASFRFMSVVITGTDQS